jgi:hypothetical protein
MTDTALRGINRLDEDKSVSTRQVALIV